MASDGGTAAAPAPSLSPPPPLSTSLSRPPVGGGAQWGGGGGADGDGGEKGKDMVLSVLNSALDLARAAVTQDEQQAPPEKVLPYYEKAILAIDTAMQLLPAGVVEKTGIAQHRNAYAARVDLLRAALRRDASARERRQRQQSRVPFEALALDPEAEMETPPTMLARRPYWVMRLLRLTVTQGGYLSPRLFVPKGMWAQVGVRFTGFAPKIQALESLLYMTIDKVIALPKPADAESCHGALGAARSFRESAQKLQGDLARAFPFVAASSGGGGGGGGGAGADPRLTTPKTQLAKLGGMVKSIGRNVTQGAAVAVQRIGASVPGKGAGDDELVYYAQLVAEVCSKCQVFDDWLASAQKARAAGVDAAEELLVELHCISDFMREAIVELVLRDVDTLLERYLRKMRKSFARMYWDADEGDI